MTLKLQRTFYKGYGKQCGIFINEETQQSYTLVENKKFNCWIGKNSTGIETAECFTLVRKTLDDEYEFEKAQLTLQPNGYLQFTSSAGQTEWFHRMVVYAFGDKNGNYQGIGKFEGMMTEIDHVDGDKLRNIPENLEVVFPTINSYRAYKNKYKSGPNCLKENICDAIDAGEEYFNEIIKQLYEEIIESKKED